MSIYERVDFAVQNAPVVDDFVESTNNLSSFTDKDDDYPIHLNQHEFPDLPNEVTLDIDSDMPLKKLFDAYVKITDYSLSQEYRDYAQRHEGQHFDAAKMLGALSARVGVRIFNVSTPEKESQLTIQPFLRVQDFKTTKLGAALVSGYPIPPSNGDQIDIKMYGYSGIEELAYIAMSRNGARKDPQVDQFYPVPLGVGTSVGTRIFYVPGKPLYI